MGVWTDDRDQAYLECVDCGLLIYGPLSAHEQQQMADRPDKFLEVRCPGCQSDWIKRELGG